MWCQSQTWTLPPPASMSAGCWVTPPLIAAVFPWASPVAVLVQAPTSDTVGRITHPLDFFKSPLVRATRTVYSTMPERASFVRKAAAPMLDRSVADACSSTSKKLGIPSTGGRDVTTGETRKTSCGCGLMSHPIPSPVNTREGSQMLPAPKVPGVKHGSSSNLVVGGMRVAEFRFGCGDSAGGATSVHRVGVDPGSCVATAGIAAGDCELCLTARDRVVRDEDICRFSV